MRTVPVLLLAGSMGIIISILGSKEKETDVDVLPIVIPILGLYISFSIYRGLKRQKQLLESYALTLTGNAVMREQRYTPSVCLYVNEIKEIVKAKSGAITVRGRERTDVIYIPAEIDG